MKSHPSLFQYVLALLLPRVYDLYFGGLLWRSGNVWEVISYFPGWPWSMTSSVAVGKLQLLYFKWGPLRGAIKPPELNSGSGPCYPPPEKPSCLLFLLCPASLPLPQSFYWGHFLNKSLAHESISVSVSRELSLTQYQI